MSVTPQISDNDDVTVNVRPTITRIVGTVLKENSRMRALAKNGVLVLSSVTGGDRMIEVPADTTAIPARTHSAG